MISQDEIETLAEWLHKEYEKASAVREWKTQKKCQVDFWDLPEANRFVMLDVAASILMRFKTKEKYDAKKHQETYP